MRQDELGERYADLRKDAGLSQAALAKKLGISHISIAYYETGERSLTLKALEAYHNYFDVSYDYLMGEAINKKPDNIQIGGIFGLSDKAIEALMFRNELTFVNEETFYRKQGDLHLALNLLIENANFTSLLYSLSELKRHYDINKPIPFTEEFSEFENGRPMELINEALSKHYRDNYKILTQDYLIEFLKFNAQDVFNNILNDMIRNEEPPEEKKKKPPKENKVNEEGKMMKIKFEVEYDKSDE